MSATTIDGYACRYAKQVHRFVSVVTIGDVFLHLPDESKTSSSSRGSGTSHWVIVSTGRDIPSRGHEIYGESRAKHHVLVAPDAREPNSVINYFAVAASPVIYMRARAEVTDKSAKCLKLYKLVAILATFSPDLSASIGHWRIRSWMLERCMYIHLWIGLIFGGCFGGIL